MLMEMKETYGMLEIFAKSSQPPGEECFAPRKKRKFFFPALRAKVLRFWPPEGLQIHSNIACEASLAAQTRQLLRLREKSESAKKDAARIAANDFAPSQNRR